jgi:hypothetical protein
MTRTQRMRIRLDNLTQLAQPTVARFSTSDVEYLLSSLEEAVNLLGIWQSDLSAEGDYNKRLDTFLAKHTKETHE